MSSVLTRIGFILCWFLIGAELFIDQEVSSECLPNCNLSDGIPLSVEVIDWSQNMDDSTQYP